MANAELEFAGAPPSRKFLKYQLRNALNSIGVNALVTETPAFFELRLPDHAVEELLTFINMPADVSGEDEENG